MKLSKTSIALLAIQLALVSSIAVKYLYQRHSSPRAWTRAVAVDPALPMRGRYLSLQLTVDGCRSTLPSAKPSEFPRNIDGSVKNSGDSSIRSAQPVSFQALLHVENGKLFVLRPDGVESTTGTQTVKAFSTAPCSAMTLAEPVNFYVSEHAHSPLPLASGSELWIEVTVPKSGPPRPLRLAVSSSSGWKPLDLD